MLPQLCVVIADAKRGIVAFQVALTVSSAVPELRPYQAAVFQYSSRTSSHLQLTHALHRFFLAAAVACVSVGHNMSTATLIRDVGLAYHAQRASRLRRRTEP
jgi:hypothetical protein